MKRHVPNPKDLHLFGPLAAKTSIVNSANEQHHVVDVFQKTARDVVWIAVGMLAEIGEAFEPSPELLLFSRSDHGVDGVL